MKQMKEVTFVTITAETDAEFNEKMNVAIAKYGISDLNEIQIEHGRSDFRAYFLASKAWEELDTIKEKKEAEGTKLWCRNCPHIIRPQKKDGTPDMRARWVGCEMHESGACTTDRACDIYYEEIFGTN